MRRMNVCFLILVGFLTPRPSFALFGEELAPLFQLVGGQVKEIETLADQVGATKEQSKLLSDLNMGIEQTVRQIQAIEALVERAQGLSPSAVRSIAELNDYLARVNDAKRAVDEVLSIRIGAAGVAIEQSSVQSETAYLMGQEMIATGGDLARESQTASPGRAAQITAASSSAQMLAQGVELQTIAQMSQIQALQLDLQRSQMEQGLEERKTSRGAFAAELARSTKRSTSSSRSKARL